MVLMAAGITGAMLMSGCGILGHGRAAGTRAAAGANTPTSRTPTSSPSASTTPTSSTIVATSGPSARTSESSSTSPSSTGVSSSSTAGAGPFNAVVTQAMGYVTKGTTVGLEAPEVISTPHTSQYLAAVATASTNHYHVHLQLTESPLGLNNRNSENGVNAGLAHDFGGFGATRYASPSQAWAALDHGLGTAPSGQKPSSVSLTTGLLGKSWSKGMVQWQEGDWTLQVTGGSPAADIQEANRMVTYLHSHFLPPTRGIITVDNAGDGPHAVVGWQEGSVLYRVSDYHSAIGAMEMAVSMRNYPSGAMPSMDSRSTFSTPNFSGRDVVKSSGSAVPTAIPSGYQSTVSPNLRYSATDIPVTGFSGTLDGHPFVLAFYRDTPEGLLIGASYNGKPVYFGYGPSPVFSVLNFTGTDVVLGSPSAGTYQMINLVTGQQTGNVSVVDPLKGYSGLGLPSHILGLPGTNDSTTIPYGSPS